jgi:hypothetical protein
MGVRLGRRTEPRVDFREAVRVIWPGKVSGIVARAVNLSRAGILVDTPTPTPCPVGSDVLCDVSLPRGPRLLRGRVAHRRVLPSAKVGMGIEFVALSPREIAELRDVVDERDQKSEPEPRPVRVRFAGTEQIVQARAYPSEGGLRLVSSLPFLKVDAEVDLTVAADVEVGAKGWVSTVALERGFDGMPRLLVDVRIDPSDRWRDPSTVLMHIVEVLIPPSVDTPSPLETAFEHASEVADHAVAKALTAEDFQEEAPFDLVEGTPAPAISNPTLTPLPHLEMSPVTSVAPIIEPSHEPSMVPSPVSSLIEDPGAAPGFIAADQTEIMSLQRPAGRWRAFRRGMLVGAVGLATFVAAVVVIQNATTRESATLPAPPLSVTQKVAAELPPVAAPLAATPLAVAPSAAAQISVEAPVAASSVAPSSDFVVGFTGSFAGSRRYPLSDPDGIAFNLPHAYPAMKLGTYRPDVPGLRSVWVRALCGGGTHLRFYYTKARPAPRIDLTRTGVRVSAP